MKNSPHKFPTVELSIDTLPAPLIEEITSGNVVTTYVGMSPLGTKESEPNWYIKRIIVDASVAGTVTTRTEYVRGKKDNYEYAWTDRLNLKYTR